MRLLIAPIAVVLLTTAMMSGVRADDISAAINVLRAVQPGAVDSAAARDAASAKRRLTPFVS